MSFSKMYSMSYYVSKLKSPDSSDDQYKNYFPTLESIVKDNPNAEILKMANYFCDADVCNMAKNGTLFYRDPNHLNINGSKYLGEKLIENNPHIAN